MKAIERRMARVLRHKGFSVREINRRLGCSKSSISKWVQDIPLSEDQIAQLKSNQDKGRAKAAQHPNGSKRKWEIIRGRCIDEARKDIPEKGSIDLLRYIGAALYWAEGYNASRNTVVFANTDPRMIKIMMPFFRKVCKVPEYKFRGKISIHPHLDAKKAEKYWSCISKIPLRQFNKPLLAVSRASKGKRDTLPNGTFRIIVNDVYVCSKIKGWIEGLSKWA